MKKSKEIKQLEKEFNCKIIPFRRISKSYRGYKEYTAWWPERNCIGLNIKRFSKLPKIMKRATVVHELQHQACCRSHCFCWKRKNDFWSEYHATKAEYEYICNNLTKRNTGFVLKSTANTLLLYKKDGDWEHFKAMKKVLKIRKIREKLGL